MKSGGIGTVGMREFGARCAEELVERFERGAFEEQKHAEQHAEKSEEGDRTGDFGGQRERGTWHGAMEVEHGQPSDDGDSDVEAALRRRAALGAPDGPLEPGAGHHQMR